MADPGNAPRPVPSLAPDPLVTDEDRNRYGHLLDRAFERGLIGPSDYEVRLRDLAEATTVDELKRIVTELPAFSAKRSAPPRPGSRGAARSIRPRDGGGPARSGRSSPWLLLVIVVVVLAVSLAVLAVFVNHLARTHNSGFLPRSAMVSAPRL